MTFIIHTFPLQQRHTYLNNKQSNSVGLSLDQVIALKVRINMEGFTRDVDPTATQSHGNI